MPSYPIRIGAQLFTNRGDTPDEARAWVRQMHAGHLSLIRLFLFWDVVQPERDRWDYSLYDAIFDEAAAQGMGIAVTLMPNDPPAWLKPALGIENPLDLDDPAVWKQGLAYVRRTAERYGKHPALDSWILWNEPGYTPLPGQYGQKAFAAWLKDSYEEIDSLNRVYHSAYRSFEDAAQEQFAPANVAQFGPYPPRLDCMRFAVSGLMSKLGQVAAEIRKADKTHLLHVNPHNVSQCILPTGQSIWAEAKVVDFLGCSAHPSWHATRFPQERLHQSVALFADLMKSATPHRDGLFWVTELQGGTNIFSGVNYLCPTPTDIHYWLWESIGAGAKAVVFWLFNPRKDGFEGGEWGLLDQRGQASPRLRAAEEVARTLEEHEALFANARPPRPDVWILHSEDTAALALIEGSGRREPSNPRNPQMAADALCGAYLMCADLGLNVQFVTEETLVNSEFPEGSIFILPGATALDESTCHALEDLVRRGGTVIADGLVGYKDRDGQVSPENRDALERLFGATLVDIEAGEDIEIQAEDKRSVLPGWFLKMSLGEDGPANVLGRFASGEPAVTRRETGQGAAVRIGTLFFQRYFSQPDAALLAYLRDLLPEMPREVVLENPSHQLRMRWLKGKDADVVILINTGDGTATARLRLERDGRLQDLERPSAYDLHAGEPLDVFVPGQSVLVFKAN